MTLGPSDCADPTKLPAKRKYTKPETVKKQLTRLLFDVYNDSAASILNSLIERESFRAETVQVTENKFRGYKATLYIDGQAFESVHSAKKKAYNAVCKTALEYLFSDVMRGIRSMLIGDNSSKKLPIDSNIQKSFSSNGSVTQCHTDAVLPIDYLQTSNVSVQKTFSSSILPQKSNNFVQPLQTSNHSMLMSNSSVPTILESNVSQQRDDNIFQLSKIGHVTCGSSVPRAFSDLVLQQQGNFVYPSISSNHLMLTRNTDVTMPPNDSSLQQNSDDFFQPLNMQNQPMPSSNVPYPLSLGTLTLEIRSKSSKVNANIECPNRTNSIKKSRKELEDFGECRLQMKKELQEPIQRHECGTTIPPHRPQLKKELKESTVKRLVEQALEFYEGQNSNTVTALHSLFGSDAFHFDAIPYDDGDAKFKITLTIGGKKYTTLATSVKKGRKNVTKMALRDFFPEYAKSSDNTVIQMQSSNMVPSVHEQSLDSTPAGENNLHIVNEVSVFKFPNNVEGLQENHKRSLNFDSRQQSDSIAKEMPNFNERMRSDVVVNKCNPDIVNVVQNSKFRENGALKENCDEAPCINKHVQGSAIADENICSSINIMPKFKVPEELEHFNFADYVASLVQQKYEEVMQVELEFRKRYSVLSGIVMVENNDITTSTVICVSTGNKCILGDSISKCGDVLFDCHAEILAKRCLLSFFYEQLCTALTTKEKSILEMTFKREFRVKDSVKFYLYISSAPCGDGRVFNFSPVQNPGRKQVVKRGVLRVKLETGMGGVPTNEYNAVSSYEAYLKGRPLVLMCCSAKLMMCNVVGIQGSLLSHFLEPVYFDGIIIGDIFHKNNLERALFERASITSSQLPAPYRLNKPFIIGNTHGEIAFNLKPGKSCMNWMVHEPTVECIQTRTGKTITRQPSRLSKRSLFEKFIRVLALFRRLNNVPNFTVAPYLKYKEDAIMYQQVKNIFLTSLEENGKGKWIKKPKEVDSFTLDDIDENISHIEC